MGNTLQIINDDKTHTASKDEKTQTMFDELETLQTVRSNTDNNG